MEYLIMHWYNKKHIFIGWYISKFLQDVTLNGDGNFNYIALKNSLVKIYGEKLPCTLIDSAKQLIKKFGYIKDTRQQYDKNMNNTYIYVVKREIRKRETKKARTDSSKNRRVIRFLLCKKKWTKNTYETDSNNGDDSEDCDTDENNEEDSDD
jgi:hypothetical protein